MSTTSAVLLEGQETEAGREEAEEAPVIWHSCNHTQSVNDHKQATAGRFCAYAEAGVVQLAQACTFG